MSERTAQDAGEQLFDTEEPEASTDAETDTQEGEQDQESLILEDESEGKTSTAEEEREKQIATWKRRVQSGEVKIKDIPANVQWVLPYVQGLDTPKASDVDVDALIERKMAAREAKQQFANLKASLQDVSLTAAQRRTLQEEFNDLREAGADKVKSLEKAIKLAGINLDIDTTLHSRMQLPPEGVTRKKAKDATGEYPDMRTGMTEEERVEYLEKLRKGKIRPAA